MVKRATVPEAPEPAEVPTDIPVAFTRGTGPGTMNTEHGTRNVFGAHLWTFDGTAAAYGGAVNVFWSAVVEQLTRALPDGDTALVGVIVKAGKRYEIRPVEDDALVDRFYEAIERAQATAEPLGRDN